MTSIKKILGLALIIIAVFSLLKFQDNLLGLLKNRQAGKKLFDYAQNIAEKCSNASYRQTCYEEEVPKLMAHISMEEAFQVTRMVQDLDKSYTYCHVLGHKLSARETAKDPEKWKEVITRCPSGLCSNGCVHGSFQERFRTETLSSEEIESLKPDLRDVCEPKSNWSPTGLEQGTCYHALGHLLMYVTGADLIKSTEVCRDVSIKPDGHNWSELCFDGAFMQIFQPLEDEDFVLVAGKQPKKEEVASFCKKFKPDEQNSCWSESWPLVFDEITKPEGLVKFCSGSILKSQHDQDRCYTGMFYVLTAQFQFDLAKVRNFCSGLPSVRRDQCFANAASRMIETDYRNIPVVVNFCSSLEFPTGKDACFEELLRYSTYNFHAGSEEFFQLCNSLPEPWRATCLKGKR